MLVGLLLGGGYAGLLVATNNFHVVIPGQVYRSAQPSAAEISEYRNRYGVMTLINLRGAIRQEPWYRDELAASKREGLTHIDFGMSVGQIQPPEKIKRLIAILASAPKPILIHSKGGADRTGLASALYLAAIAKQGESSAEAQLSIRYGHFSIPFVSQGYPMDESFENVEAMLGYTDAIWTALLNEIS
uniref:Tyrosine phosphatase family protein n=1 Tax=Rhizobium rhizogenes TaxID=359 RepID=A0A7S4ZTY8_RHIRH|nr:dual specificity protein phosphatase family protein [Rhizobium rhizogenes]QCL10596.1 tyrosine phosphatase family protein [Rhizobium rhizogenes]